MVSPIARDIAKPGNHTSPSHTLWGPTDSPSSVCSLYACKMFLYIHPLQYCCLAFAARLRLALKRQTIAGPFSRLLVLALLMWTAEESRKMSWPAQAQGDTAGTAARKGHLSMRPPAAMILIFSAGLIGLWSCVRDTARHLPLLGSRLPRTARESPVQPTQSLLPCPESMCSEGCPLKTNAPVRLLDVKRFLPTQTS